MKKIFLTLLLALMISVPSFAQCGMHREVKEQETPYSKSSISIPAEENVELKTLSKIKKKEAKKAALETYKGKVKKASLISKENKLVWLVEVNGSEGQKEVFIDPGNSSFLGYGLTK